MSTKTYLLVRTSDGVMPDGATPAPAGTVWMRIVWDGATAYTPPPGTHLAADDGTQPGSATLAAAIANKAIVA